MSDKIRIHELGKEYGLSGKDCAAKLRDYGFSNARSHMTALDDFESMQARGLLEANGCAPIAEYAAAVLGNVGGVKVKKKLKKKVEDDAEEPSVAHEAPRATPTPPIVELTEPEPAHVEPEPEAPVAEVEAPPAVEPAPAPVAEATARVEPQPEPVTEAPVAEAPVAEAPAKVEEAEAEVVNPAAAAAPVKKVSAPKARAAKEASTEAPGAKEAPAEAAAPATADPAEKPPVEKVAPAAKKSGPKGKITGFIDPSKLQQAQPRRRTESRRLQSRDDATPNVRPTFTGRGGRAGAAGGPVTTGKELTAAQLREREQGRFLRRQGRRSGGGGRGRRGGGGSRSHDEVNASPFSGENVVVVAPITITKLAEALKLKANVVIKRAMFSKLGMFNPNSTLDDDTAALVAGEFDVELDIRHEVTAEMQHLEEVKRARDEIAEEHLVHRAPTVAFLGHVDHGKTSLIDKIRQTRVADGESGGITQHIGAYQVETATGHGITIVDTPGHEAFTAMRARGAKAVDIVVLVVAGDDGVKPSTAEAINHARAANTPIVVALNKKDKPGFNAAQAIQQLMGHELIPEAYGGQTAFFEVSAMTGEGIEALLEHIFLMSEAELDMRAHPGGPASGVVLEAQVEQGRGIVAHLLMQDGTLNQGDVILAGGGYGKVKSIHDDRGRTIKSAGPSTPVQVTGLAALPGVGDPFYIVSSLDKAKEVATERERNSRAILMASNRGGGRELERILGSKPKIDINVVNLIVRTDVQGSAEVIRHEVEKLVHEEVEVKLVNVGVGPITESDVNLASTSGALLVAFHVGVNSKARKEAERFGLDIRRYEVIYELLDDLRGAMEGALAPEFEEEIVGHVEIRRLFKSSKIGLIAGCVVLDGRIRRSSKIRLLRDNIVVHTGELGSLRREAEDTREVREGFECGIVIKDYRDIEEGDIIEAFKLKEIKRKLGELKPTDPDDKG